MELLGNIFVQRVIMPGLFLIFLDKPNSDFQNNVAFYKFAQDFQWS